MTISLSSETSLPHKRSELEALVQKLVERVQKLEKLVQIVSRGKYMWESTFDAITLPVQIVGSDYRIHRANLSIADVGGGDIIQYAGKYCYEAFASRKTPCPGCPLQEALRENTAVSSLLSERIHSHEFEATAYPYEAGSGGEKAAVVSYRDVTEERRLQQEVVQQEKLAAIGMLAGGVAHEINNPLGGILAFTQLLLRDVGGNDALREDLEEVERAAVRCKRIVADLLDFSRMSRDKDRRPVDLKVMLEKIFPFIKGEIRALNIDFRCTIAPDTPTVFGQADRLQQVFLNLMTNSCHAMPNGGTLSIEMTKGKHGGVCALVRDTGVGISKENMRRIFDPFFTTKVPGKGTGLGLSISYRIIRDHGGSIDVESVEGKGTTFTITFPASSVS